jgi:uncharacterized protein with PQ loop repeat
MAFQKHESLSVHSDEQLALPTSARHTDDKGLLMPAKSHHHIKKYAKVRAATPLEKAMVCVAIAEPLMTLPQIIDLYAHPGKGSVSMLTWVLYLSASLMWLVYGIRIQNKPLIVTGALWLCMEVLVITGILL